MKNDISFHFLKNTHGQTGGSKEGKGWVGEQGQRGEVGKEKESRVLPLCASSVLAIVPIAESVHLCK